MARKGKTAAIATKGGPKYLFPAITPSDVGSLLMSLSRVSNKVENTALDRAQEKAFDAMEARSARKRAALAREALAISPLCGDAYLVLAEQAPDPGARLALLRQAVQAGTQALGKRAFQRDAGFFWSLIETRPYMRARHDLAMALWAAGEQEEAVEHYRDMLRLNPDDNQGIRHLLTNALLSMERDEEAREVLARYKDDDFATTIWSQALLTFRSSGDSDESQNVLLRARSANPHVTPYLLGEKRMPASLPHLIGIGNEDEAIAYVAEAAAIWAATPGALDWLGGAYGRARGRGVAAPDCASMADMNPIDNATLALLLLGLHDKNRVWKSFDWEVLQRLHEKGLISKPAGPAKSVVLSEKGLREAERLHGELFGKTR